MREAAFRPYMFSCSAYRSIIVRCRPPLVHAMYRMPIRICAPVTIRDVLPDAYACFRCVRPPPRISKESTQRFAKKCCIYKIYMTLPAQINLSEIHPRLTFSHPKDRRQTPRRSTAFTRNDLQITAPLKSLKIRTRESEECRRTAHCPMNRGQRRDPL